MLCIYNIKQTFKLFAYGVSCLITTNSNKEAQIKQEMIFYSLDIIPLNINDEKDKITAILCWNNKFVKPNMWHGYTFHGFTLNCSSHLIDGQVMLYSLISANIPGGTGTAIIP